mgnify:CR=1 FL=1|jgi:acyl dehydratase
MIDPGLIGRFGPDFEVPVERGALRNFARAAHAPWPAYLDDRHAPIPPAFLVCANVWWGYSLERPRGTVLAGIDHDLSIPLHAEEAHVFHGEPPRAGDLLIARACLESVTQKQGGRGGDLTFLVLLTQFRDTTDRLVAEARATTVTTANAPENGGGWGSEPPPYEPRYTSLEPPDPFAAIARQGWDDLAVGAGPGPVATGPLTMHDMVRFQAAAGEDNPLHYDLAHAAAEGFPGMFGLGMHQASALASYAVRWLGESRVRSFRARFRNVFWVGDALTYDGHVAALREEDGRRYADLALACTRDSDGAVVVAVTMTFALD